MTDTTPTDAPSETPPSGGRPARGGGLEAMLLPELKRVAGGLGLKVSGMRKGQIVEAIRAAQGGSTPSGASGSSGSSGRSQRKPDEQQGGQQGGQPSGQQHGQPEGSEPQAAPRAGRAPRERRSQEGSQDGSQEGPQDGSQGAQPGGQQNGRQDEQQKGKQGPQDEKPGRQDRQQDSQGKQQDGSQDRQRESQREAQREAQRDPQGKQPSKQGGESRQGGDSRQDQQDDDDQGGSRRNRRRRGRDRQGNQGNQGQGNQGNQGNQGGDRQDRQDRQGGRRGEPDLQILEDDVLAPCAGILDLMDNYAFVRTSGYLPGADDVYVSMSMVRKHGLRRGDAVVGQVRQPREGERREKFNPLVRIDSVNGADPDAARQRVEFANLTPLYPSERLRLETAPGELVGRIVDLVAPVGKGQRGLVVSPVKAGKTRVLRVLADAITTNNPECHLMVVLVDERPEEVTEFQRSVKGEVIGSTFDRPPADHTLVAELAIERAKRLVELGHDVVLLVDGLTRLGRAYNLAAPSGGRTLAGGVDSTALHPPKRFFGAARNIENGGSLTIIATVVVEGGSMTDEVILEELRDTGNMELRLSRELAEQRLFPAIDPVRSGTRREDLLVGPEELGIVWTLRRELAAHDVVQAHQQLVEQVRASGTNMELLRRAQASAR